MFKRILINAALIILSVLVFEYLCFLSVQKENSEFKKLAGQNIDSTASMYKTEYAVLKSYSPAIYRKSFIIENASKKPVILFGCSFAEGAGLQDNDTPCARISKLTGRSCINKAKGASGLQLMYYQLHNENFYKENPEADYIIYIYIHDHLTRLYSLQPNSFINTFNLRYKLKNGSIEEIKPLKFLKPLYSSFAAKVFFKAQTIRKSKAEYNNFKLFNALMRENASIIKEHYPNAQILFIEYPERYNMPIPEEEIKELENMGLTYVSIRKLTADFNLDERQYWHEDNIHPSNAAWDIIMPRIIEKYIR